MDTAAMEWRHVSDPQRWLAFGCRPRASAGNGLVLWSAGYLQPASSINHRSESSIPVLFYYW